MYSAGTAGICCGTVAGHRRCYGRQCCCVLPLQPGDCSCQMFNVAACNVGQQLLVDCRRMHQGRWCLLTASGAVDAQRWQLDCRHQLHHGVNKLLDVDAAGCLEQLLCGCIAGCTSSRRCPQHGTVGATCNCACCQRIAAPLHRLQAAAEVRRPAAAAARPDAQRQRAQHACGRLGRAVQQLLQRTLKQPHSCRPGLFPLLMAVAEQGLCKR